MTMVEQKRGVEGGRVGVEVLEKNSGDISLGGL